MPSSIEKIVDRFLFPTNDLIIGTLDHESVADIHLKLNPNAASVQSNLGCGTLNLLFLTVSPAVYATLWYCHIEATKIFTKYENMDKALRQLLLASTDKLYVRSIGNKYIGYGKTNT